MFAPAAPRTLLLSWLLLLLSPRCSCHYFPVSRKYFVCAEYGRYDRRILSWPLAPGMRKMAVNVREECLELVATTTPGATISFTFTDYKGRGAGCPSGFVQFRDGGNARAKPIAKYCNRSKFRRGFPTITSTGNKLYIFSNITVAAGWFKAGIMAGLPKIKGYLPSANFLPNNRRWHRKKKGNKNKKKNKKKKKGTKGVDEEEDDDGFFLSDSDYQFYVDDRTVVSAQQEVAKAQSNATREEEDDFSAEYYDALEEEGGSAPPAPDLSDDLEPSELDAGQMATRIAEIKDRLGGGAGGTTTPVMAG